MLDVLDIDRGPKMRVRVEILLFNKKEALGGNFFKMNALKGTY
jgi:hypothetical protein